MGVRLIWVLLLLTVATASGVMTYRTLAAFAPDLRLPRATASPTPVPTPSATAEPSPTATATVTPAATATASPAAEIKVLVAKTAVPSDHHYLLLGSTSFLRVVLLDLAARASSEVATITVDGPSAGPSEPQAMLSASADGRTVLVAVPSARQGAVILIRPEQGQGTTLVRGDVSGAIVSPDATRIAVARNDRGGSLAGLWIGPPSADALRRVIADEPQSAAAIAPLAFSRDGGLLIVSVGAGEPGTQAWLLSSSASDVRVERSQGATRLVGGDAGSVGPARHAEFINDREAFVWSSRASPTGTEDAIAYLFDANAKRGTGLYRAPTSDSLILTAVWRQGTDEFATIEAPPFSGTDIGQRTLWLRGRDGSARKIAQPGRFVGEVWWSPDGTKLYATLGGDDSNGRVVDLLGSGAGLLFCLRGGTPGSCT